MTMRPLLSLDGILVVESDLFVQEDIGCIVGAVFPDAPLYPCGSVTDAMTLIAPLDTLDLAIIDASDHEILASGLAEQMGRRGTGVIHLDSRPAEMAIAQPRWLRLEKPFSEDTLRAALSAILSK
ncbi:MAG: hypothetical protein KDA73_13620 [Rhodobacteraceae bacterium]|nr:hypothetical protein [Paracoccaceae bacterium]